MVILCASLQIIEFLTLEGRDRSLSKKGHFISDYPAQHQKEWMCFEARVGNIACLHSCQTTQNGPSSWTLPKFEAFLPLNICSKRPDPCTRACTRTQLPWKKLPHLHPATERDISQRQACVLNPAKCYLKWGMRTGKHATSKWAHRFP